MNEFAAAKEDQVRNRELEKVKSNDYYSEGDWDTQGPQAAAAADVMHRKWEDVLGNLITH